MDDGQMPERALRSQDVRVTPQRAVVLETLIELAKHATAGEIHEEARERLPGLSLATVYRALNSLREAGLVDLFSTASDVQRYAYRDPENPHSHLVCRHCGTVVEVDPEVITPLSQAVRRNYDFQLDGRHLTFIGLCGDCAA